jgi:hypothetical protein
MNDNDDDDDNHEREVCFSIIICREHLSVCLSVYLRTYVSIMQHSHTHTQDQINRTHTHTR